MTMPHERFRCLRWARELLENIASCNAGSQCDRSIARSLLETFPSRQDLLAWVRGGLALPEGAASAIDAGGKYFRELRHASWLSTAQRQHLEFVLRHYPADGEAPLWVTDDCAGTLHEWLMPEDAYADR